MKKVRYIILFLALIACSILITNFVVNASSTSSHFAQRFIEEEVSSTTEHNADQVEYEANESVSEDGFLSENSGTITVAALVIIFLLLFLII